LTDTKAANLGSASHLGQMQVPRDAHFVYDYTRRRVPLPVVSYLAVADTPLEAPGPENPAKKVLDRMRDLIEPAVIAEEELNSAYMEKLIRENLAKINTELFEAPVAEGAAKPQASLTMVLSDARRAYIGHAGTSRVYLLHGGRLYDLTPTPVAEPVQPAVEPQQPPQDALPLFPAAAAEPAAPAAPAQPAKGVYLGQEAAAAIGYNEVEIVPGDIIALVTDGLWRTVSEEELVENLLSAMNVQRSSSQLVRLAFSRDSSDNATMVAWQYVVGGAEEVIREPRAAVKAVSREKTKARAAEGILVALLVLVLIGIFAVGFAFGWRITDTFRKPAKEKARQAAAAKSKQDQSKSSQPQGTTPQTTPAATTPQTTTPAGTTPTGTAQTATVKGNGVRMRSTADPSGSIVGMLKDGQKLTVLGEVVGTDSLGWTKVKGTVTSAGVSKEGEGYVRNDFLIKATSTTTSTTPTTTP
jgi:serine/threonine protein phosphatase PrpC/type II secretory pathway pseudopilin PulG